MNPADKIRRNRSLVSIFHGPIYIKQALATFSKFANISQSLDTTSNVTALSSNDTRDHEHHTCAIKDSAITELQSFIPLRPLSPTKPQSRGTRH